MISGDIGHLWGFAFRDGDTVICRCSLCGAPKPGTDTSVPADAKVEPCANTVIFFRGDAMSPPEP